jgi:phenylalanyl-tRNA synthetase beta chain
MKFSYSLIKEMVPNLPPKAKLAEELSLKSFEVDEISGDTMEIKVNANRWGDATSHVGIAREVATIFGLRAIPLKTTDFRSAKTKLGLKVGKSSDCYRYIGVLADIGRRGTTPSWMKKYLSACGIRPVNPIVDALNYVMIEVGQPMHAFDADKVKGDIIVRKAKKGEKIITIDGGKYELTSADTVIADQEKVLAIAGIKGGKAAEITSSTKRIILEAANFDQVSVYKTSRNIKLETDASRRYAHGMSSEKAKIGMERAIRLLTEICFIRLKASVDKYESKESKKIIKFDIERFKKITGVEIGKNQAMMILKKLGFVIKKGDLIEVPAERMDVSIFEDLVEEVIRIYGLDEIKAVAPVISITPLHNDPIFAFGEKIKGVLTSIGFDEILSYSFGEYASPAPEIENPISRGKAFMRTNLSDGLNETIDKNHRDFSHIKIFELGKVFPKLGEEHWSLSIAIKSVTQEYPLRVLRGAIETLLKGVGIPEASFIPSGKKLILQIENKGVGDISVSKDGERAFFEVNVQKLLASSEGEFEYEPVSPYPSVMRDISMWIPGGVTVGEIFEIVDSVNADNLNDVDLADYYPDDNEGRVGITIRLVFQSQNKTLTDAEIDVWMEKIGSALERQKGVEIR